MVTDCGVVVSDQLLSVPVLPVALSVTWSVQVPLMSWPSNCASPLGSLGLKVPV